MAQHIWEQLVKQALLGTARQPFIPPPLPQESLKVLLQDKPPEIQLLNCAALMSTYQRVGAVLPTVSESQTFPPCPPETKPLCSPRAASHLNQLLQGEFLVETTGQLLTEWLRLLQSAGQRIPPIFVPTLLEEGIQSQYLRPYLATTVGHCGYWLAQLNPHWRYLDNPDDTIEDTWETGNSDARLSFLKRCRQQDPAHAREQLAKTWSQESAKDRVAFLSVFWTSLNPADEAFLITCSEDRSVIVRRLAIQMLGSIPTSAFCQMALTRLSQYLEIKPSGANFKVEVTLPSVFDPAWIKEGLHEDVLSMEQSLGQKAGWLSQLLEQVRPSLLLAHFNVSLKQYLRAIRRTDFAEMLEQTLVKGIHAHKDAAAALALIRQTRSAHLIRRLSDMVEALPEEEREQLLLDYLGKNVQALVQEWAQIQRLFELFPNGLPVTLSQLLLNEVLPAVIEKYHLAAALRWLAAVLAIECFPHIPTQLQTILETDNRGYRDFLKIYAFRFQMKKEF